MALIPHKEDPNYQQQMQEYQKDNSRWGGNDMNKGMPPKESPAQGQKTTDKPSGRP